MMPSNRYYVCVALGALALAWGVARTPADPVRPPTYPRGSTPPWVRTIINRPQRVPVNSTFSDRQKQRQENVDPATIVTDTASGKDDILHCANLVYAGSKSSVCFSNKFLDTVRRETNCQPSPNFSTIKLATNDLFNFPFSVMTGEGSFILQDGERKMLRAYLMRGGFVLASAGCSSRDWDASFRGEIKRIFPEYKLKPLPLEHPLYHTVFDVNDIRLTHGGRGQIEGMEIDGKIVLIYSSEGLNDTANVKGCCCCGGNEVVNCHEINVNAFTYALTH